MTVRELIIKLLDQPLDAGTYVGKGIGPVGSVQVVMGEIDHRLFVVLEPKL